MSKKRVPYQNLLKQAIAEFDTSKTVDVKGPMLDPILQWDGQGEIPVYKDAASILERYYFEQEEDKGVEVSEMEYNEDGTEAKTPSEKHTETGEEGTEQAGTSDKNIPGEKKEIQKDLAKEQDESAAEEEDVEESAKVSEQDEGEEEDEAEKVSEQDEGEDEGEEEMEESAKVTEDIENAVIEKLIAEMEDEDEGEEENVEEQETMKHATGDGTEQAGTGDSDKEVPDRNDVADQMVKPKKIEEQDEPPKPEEEEELDVDQEVTEQSAVPGGPSPTKKGEDAEEDVYEEAFQLFQEAIDEDDSE